MNKKIKHQKALLTTYYPQVEYKLLPDYPSYVIYLAH